MRPVAFQRFTADETERKIFQPFHCVALGPPWVVAGQRGRRRAGPRIAQHTVERIESVEAEIRAERADQRLVAGLPVIARQTRESDQQRIAQTTHRAFAEDVQPVADLHFLQFAQVIIELGERFIRRFLRVDPAIEIEPRRTRQFHDLVAEQVDPARINPGGLVIFVDQPLQIGERAIGFGAGQRRGQVIDDHGGRTAFRLRAFAGVVDDERIDMRHRPQRGFGETGFRQRQRLARQPFQIAVLAHMNDRVRPVRPAQPRIEREVTVRRDKVGVVIGFFGVDVVAARRLQPDRDIAAAEGRDGETPAIGRARDVKRISLGRAPFVGHRIAHGVGKARQKYLVVGQ